MATVRLTVRQLDKLGLWEKVREYKGWNPYIRNEGQISDDEVVEFDDEFKVEEKSYKYFAYINGNESFSIKSDYILNIDQCVQIDDKDYIIYDIVDSNELLLRKTDIYRVYKLR